MRLCFNCRNTFRYGFPLNLINLALVTFSEKNFCSHKVSYCVWHIIFLSVGNSAVCTVWYFRWNVLLEIGVFLVEFSGVENTVSEEDGKKEHSIVGKRIFHEEEWKWSWRIWHRMMVNWPASYTHLVSVSLICVLKRAFIDRFYSICSEWPPPPLRSPNN